MMEWIQRQALMNETTLLLSSLHLCSTVPMHDAYQGQTLCGQMHQNLLASKHPHQSNWHGMARLACCLYCGLCLSGIRMKWWSCVAYASKSTCFAVMSRSNCSFVDTSAVQLGCPSGS